jgi:hypothetical protein
MWEEMASSIVPMVEQLEAQQATAPAHSVTLGLLESIAIKHPKTALPIKFLLQP